MTDLAEPEIAAPVGAADNRPVKAPDLTPATLCNADKAAIIIGVLGSEGAAPILEQLDESSLRSFASAMSRIQKIKPQVVEQTIREFIRDLDEMGMTVNGGLSRARSILADFVNDATLTRIMDDAESPSVHNVWQKLTFVDDGALSEFLASEHSQTAAVVVSKLSAEHAARVLGKLEEKTAREIVVGLTRIASLEQSVIEAIGHSVSTDFLANVRQGGTTFKPEDKIGAIMNYTPGQIRNAVLDFLEDKEPEFCDLVKSKMFTFQDIPGRVEKRDIAAVVRNTEGDVLLQALAGAAENAPETRDFILTGISSRIAEQVRGDLEELGKVKVREAEAAQNIILKTIRDLETSGEIKLIALED